MADSPAFEALCSALEEGSDLDRLEARGTVRLALKNAGLEPRTASASQLVVVVQRLLPGELSTRGVADVDAVCATLRRSLSGLDDAAASSQSPEAVFARLGGTA